MSKITGIKPAGGREKRIKLYLDGSYAGTLLAEVAVKSNLRVGCDLTAEQLEAIRGKDGYQHCYNAAVRLLGYRPRSEAEIRERLLRRGYGADYTEKALVSLREQGLVDDAVFARFWNENRQSFSPRSRRLTRLELKRKGLAGDIIEQTLKEIDDSESAYRAAAVKARRISQADYNEFRRRLASFLGRRGFAYDVIRQTVEIVWKEVHG